MKKTTLFRLAMAQANPQEFARQFPCAGNRATEHGFHFRDEQSRENFDAAMKGLAMKGLVIPWETRQPITIITGPPASGKSRLARVIAAALGDPEPHRVFARSARLLENDLITACTYKLKTIIIDDISQSLLYASGSEWRMMTSSVPWAIKPPGKPFVEEITHRPWLILTINSPVRLPDDLSRRARLIELIAPPEIDAANEPSPRISTLDTLASADLSQRVRDLNEWIFLQTWIPYKVLKAVGENQERNLNKLAAEKGHISA